MAENPGSVVYGLKGGAHDWNRTSDLFLTKEVLYRLSYMSRMRVVRDA
jgi:hypothetical protein